MADFTRQEIIDKILTLPKPMNFSGVNFSDLDLSGLDLSNTVLNSAKFDKCNIDKLNLNDCELKDSAFTQSFGSPFLENTAITNFEITATQQGEFNFLGCKCNSIKIESFTRFKFVKCELDRLTSKLYESITIDTSDLNACSFQNTNKTIKIEIRKSNIEYCGFVFKFGSQNSLKLIENKFNRTELGFSTFYPTLYTNTFYRGHFHRITFKDGTISSNEFYEFEFIALNFESTTFEGNKLVDSSIMGERENESKISNSLFRDNNIAGGDINLIFDNCRLFDNLFENTSLNLSLTNSELKGNKFIKSNVTIQSIDSSTLENCTFDNVKFYNCDFSKLTLDNLTVFKDVTFFNCTGHQNIVVRETKKKGFLDTLLGK